MPLKKKRIVKSKQELVEEAKKLQEVNRMRQIVKEKLYPALLKHSKSPENAKNLVAVVVIAIKQAFQNQMQKQTIAEFKLLDALDKKGADYQKYKEIIEILEQETVGKGIGLLEGFSDLVDSTIREEMSTKPLKDLGIKLL